jgi:hypothetical protein
MKIRRIGRMKQFKTLILIAIMMFSFAACRNSDGMLPIDTTAPQTEPTAEAPNPTDSTEPQYEGTDPIYSYESNGSGHDTQMNNKPAVSETSPIESNTTKEKTLFTFTIENHEFYFGMPFSSMLEHFKNGENQYNPEEIVDVKETKTVYIRNSSGSLIEVGIYNDFDEPVVVGNCSIYSIALERDSSDNFFFSPTDKSLDFNGSVNDAFAVLGESFMQSDEKNHIAYMWIWNQSKDQRMISVGISFDKKTSNVEYIYLARETYTW